MPAAVVLSFDRLHLGYLGCFGNDWIETPNLNRLAVESVLFDAHFVDQVDRRIGRRSWWSGITETFSGPPRKRPHDLVESLGTAGVVSSLLFETGREPGVDDLQESEDAPVIAPRFDYVIPVDGADSEGQKEIELPFGRLVREVEARLKTGRLSLSDNELIWIHSRGVTLPFFPPHEFYDLYFDEFNVDNEDEDALGDPVDDDVVDEQTPYIDELSLNSELAHRRELLQLDRDVRLARALYAAYVTSLDRWLGKLWGVLEKQPGWDQTLFIVVGGTGQRLGERGPLGSEPGALTDELIHTPLVVRTPDPTFAGGRREALVQPYDLPPTLCEWFGAKPPAEFEGESLLPLIRGEKSAIRDAVFFTNGEGDYGMRTTGYLALTDRPYDRDKLQLYLMPEDRWSISNVALQHPDAADACHSRLASWIDANNR
jgi:arylsulfatase A-like enzyme